MCPTQISTCNQKKSSESPYFPFQIAPVYISETANPSSRGALNIMFQLCTTIGILIASGINYGEHFGLEGMLQALHAIQH